MTFSCFIAPRKLFLWKDLTKHFRQLQMQCGIHRPDPVALAALSARSSRCLRNHNRGRTNERIRTCKCTVRRAVCETTPPTAHPAPVLQSEPAEI